MTRHRSVFRSLAIVGGLIGVAIAVVGGVWLITPQGRPHARQPRRVRSYPSHVVPARAQFFSPDSIWNQVLPADAPLDPKSTSIVGNLAHQVATEATGIAAASYGTPIYTVGPDQPTGHVTLDQGNASGPLQQAFDAVPIPANAQPAPGTDGYLVVYQPTSDTMWEFWKTSRDSAGDWRAEWGGRMIHVSTDPGYYRNVVDSSGRVLEQASWGAPATSLPLVGGTMLISELRAGAIHHALALQVHNTCAGVWSFPAQRTDGNVTADPTCIPEGAHFRLDPNLNLASLHLPHFVYLMAVAAQRYGLIVDDRTAGVGFRAEDPAQFKAQYGYNPYSGPHQEPGTADALFDQWPPELVRQFPWSHLELLKLDLRTSADTTSVVESQATG